jgi:hypothetical protein
MLKEQLLGNLYIQRTSLVYTEDFSCIYRGLLLYIQRTSRNSIIKYLEHNPYNIIINLNSVIFFCSNEIKVDKPMDILYRGVTGPITITDTGKGTKECAIIYIYIYIYVYIYICKYIYIYIYIYIWI